MERVGEHPIPAGPLAVRWLAYEEPRPRAGAYGASRVSFENAGTAVWRDVKLAYHWLDDRGNPIVWDGWRTELGEVEPGTRIETEATVQAPLPPGRYVLAFDLVLEGRWWLSEVGNKRLDLPVAVAPRIERRLAVDGAVVANQKEALVPVDEAEAVAFLAPGCEPDPDWSRRVLDAHQEGFAIVGGSVDAGRNRALAPWRDTTGRNPSFDRPLLCPSIVRDVEPEWHEPVEGLPAATAPPFNPAIYDGRIRVRLRSGRRRA